MVSNTQLSALLVDWTTALVNNDIAQVQKYLIKEPELLWTPIPQALDNLDHLEQRLVESNKLGSTFQPVSAIHFTCLYMNQEDRFRLLAYLIEQSSLHDLDTRFWGECNNSTLHLACFLESTQIARLLMDKGVSATPSNDLGYVPSDITSSDTILQYLKQQKQQQLSRNRSVRPNYSTPDRFKLLRELAEETTNTAGEDQKKLEISLDRQKSDGRFFRKGRVKETQQKVLTEEEAELEKQRLKRQMEVAQLVKKSAVKNNPLFMKLEKKAYTLPNPPSKSATSVAVDSSSTTTTAAATLPNTTTEIMEDEEDLSEHPIEGISESKRNSRVISSLKVNSYVSSSVFVQADEDAIEPKSPPTIVTMTDSHQANDEQDDNKLCTTSTLYVNETQTQIFSTEPDELLDDEQSSLPVDQPKMASVLNQETSTSTPTHTADTEEESTDNDDYDDDESDVEGYFDPATNNNSNVVNSSYSLSKINYSPAAADKKIVYPDIRTYYEHNKAIRNAPQQNQPRERDEETEDSDEDDQDDEEEEEEEEEIVSVQFATRLATPIYKSVKILNEDRLISPTLNKVDETHSLLPPEKQAMDVTEQTQPSASNRGAEIDAPSVEPSKSSPPVRPQRSDLRRNSSTASNMSGNAIAALKQLEKQDSKEMKRMSGSQKAAWTMSMSSWAAILDREFNLEELDQEKKLKEIQRLHQASNKTQDEASPTTDYLGSDKVEISDQDVDLMLRQGSLPNSRTSLEKTLAADSMLSLSLNFTDFETPVIPKVAVQKSISTNTSAPQIGEIPRLNASKSVRRKPIASSLSEPNIQQPQQQRVKQNSTTFNKKPFKKTGHGKLYLHVNGIQDILLPLPKDRAYVRCVVSDGRFEYMSRYEILSQNINFDYECVIDTHPDMIITISLHVRPDYVMKSRTPFSRLFSKKKKKECLSGYVNKEDGAIGQARFALAHMLPVCQQNSYLAGFHCFNAWYSRSFKERHRQKKKKRDPDQDVLKVVGNFDVEMLYLPVDDYNQKQPFPRNLRECDEIIKQLHQSVESTTKASTSLSPSPSERYHTF